MNIEELLGLILGDSKQIAEAISAGAGWEIWMQIEMVSILRAAGMQVAREIHYPEPFEALSVDLVASKEGTSYAIELKCETGGKSGKAGGKPILTALESDAAKITSFSIGPSAPKRWVVGIAYSAPSKKKFAAYADLHSNAAAYGESNSVGVIVLDADAL